MIYIILALLILGLSHVYACSTEKQRRYVWYIACFAMWFVIAFRGMYIGNDTIGYVHGFRYVRVMEWPTIAVIFKKDTGFWLLTKALSYISDTEVFFLAANAFLACIGVWDYIKRNTNNPVLALFFFITIGNFNFLLSGMRQSVAMSLCLLSLRFVERKKIIPFLILVLLGAACHKSAFIFLPMFYWGRRQISALNMAINIIGLGIVAEGYEIFLSQVEEILGYGYGVEKVSNGLIYYLLLLFTLWLVFLAKQTQKYQIRDTINANSAIIATAMWTIRLFSRTIERPCMYWLTSIPVVLVNALNGLKKDECYWLYLCASVGLALCFSIKRNWGAVYYFCW